MKCIIVDDELKSRQIIAGMLQKYCPEVSVVAQCGSADDAFASINRLKPDLVLLDVEMPGASGFDLLSRYESIFFETIFITAYDHYAIQAIKSSALDYLLKPVNIEELREAVARAGKRLKNQGVPKLQVLNKLAVPTGTGLIFLEMAGIIKIEADRAYSILHLADKRKIVSTRSLREYEDLLPGESFFRAHHSSIINLQHIISYQRGDGGQVIMSDLSAVDISKRRKKDFLALFSM